MRTKGLKKIVVFMATALLAAGVSFSLGVADAQASVASTPGQHNRYKFELEPNIFYLHGNWYETGGFGLRASIPFMHNGPIKTINNNMAINFGAQMAFFDGTFDVSLPVAAQWNFYVHEIISVGPELGMEFTIGNVFRVHPVFNAIGRFQFSRFGLLVRMGYPELTVGANIQF
ncbi:MAG: hypothetical protein MK135_08575 [Polyangiaceae bacterium]|nr:hypothetical protein [Polyangiaceae bacterium]